jgi:lambda family phage tail tape measure protein
MASLTYAVDVQTSGAISSLASLQKQITGIGTAALATGAVAAGAFALKGIVNTTRELEELRGAFTTVTGDAAKSAQEFDRVRELSMQLGTNQRALSETYVKLANSGIKPTNGILTTLVDVSKNATDQFGALTAAADLFSRTVSGGLGLEDLNRLQDRGIPVFKILQEQLGLSRLEIAKFGKTAEGAEKIRQALYKGFQEQFGGTAVRELTSINSQLEVLQTITDATKESFGKGLVDAIGKSVGTVGQLSGGLQAVAKAMGEALGGAIVFLINNLNIIIPLVTALASAWAAVKLFTLAQGILAMATAFKALTMAMMRNPITIIAVGVAALIAGFVALVQQTGSVGNALKTLGNIGIKMINTLVNAFIGFGKAVGQVMVGVGNAIIAGLNPFDNKSVMGELEKGVKNARAVFGKQMASEGPISFKFKLDPVAVSKAKPAFDLGAGGYQGPALGAAGAAGESEKEKKAREKGAEDAKKIAEQMREQAAAARQVTQELVLQNAASNEMRELEISLIGKASEYANLIRSNAQARKTAAEEIRGLEAKIVEEKAKGKEANAGVIVELKAQVTEKQKQLNSTLLLNQSEKDRTIELGLQKNILQQQLGLVDHLAQLNALVDEEGLRSDLIRGKIGKEQYDRQLALQRTTSEYNARREKQEKTLADLTASKSTVEADALRRQMADESAAFELRKGQMKVEQDLTDRQRKSARAGIRAALDNAKAMSEPFVVAEQMTTSLFNSMTNALDTLVSGGKIKFGDLAKSIIADLAKIALKAAALRIFETVGSAILGRPVSIPKLAVGGPTMAGKPYIVGEKGPELFVPNSAGSIMTNASMNRNAGVGESVQPVVNNTYITNNISAIDSRSVAQMFVENRKSLLGASMMARKEMPYGT